METNKIKFSTEQELLEILSTVRRSAQPCTLESTTVPKLTKKSRSTGESFAEVFPKGQILSTKKAYFQVMVNYENRENSKLVKAGKEANFVSGELPWGAWVDGAVHFILEHKGGYYLRYYKNANANAQHSDYVLHYEDGTELTEAEQKIYWADFAPKKSSSSDVRSEKFVGIMRMVLDGKIIIRKGFEYREDKGAIFNWHTKRDELYKAS